jgi:hypothetical protein
MPGEPVDPQLDRAGRRLGRPGRWLILLALMLSAPGILLLAVAEDGTAESVGIALLSLAGAPAVVGFGLLLAHAVAWWAARGKPFA